MSAFPTAPADSPADPQRLAASGNPVFAFAPGRLRAWGLKSAFTLVDQGLTSVAGFGVNLMLARWLAPDLYGAFAVVFAAFLFISGFHNVLVLEPLSVMGPSRYADRLPAYFRAQLAVHGVLVGVLSLVGLLGGLILWRVTPRSPLVSAMFGSAMVLSLLLLLWLARRMCYVMQRPGVAVAGSAAYLLLIVAGLAALRYFDKVSPFSAFLLMGGGSLLATCILVGRLGPQVTVGAGGKGISWRAVLRENWTYGRWLVGSTVLWSVATQTQVFLLAAILGLGAAGILRAMQLPSLVMTQINTATALLVLPALSYDFGRGSLQRLRQKAFLINVGLGGVAGCSVLALLVLASPTERFLFGGKFAQYAWLIPVLALGPAVTTFSIGYSMALRAVQKPHFDLVANGVAAPVGLLSAIAFMHWWGLAGAAASMVTSLAAYTFVYGLSYKRFIKKAGGGE
jgi:O-antigen/teichoic acid export membrane protein